MFCLSRRLSAPLPEFVHKFDRSAKLGGARFEIGQGQIVLRAVDTQRSKPLGLPVLLLRVSTARGRDWPPQRHGPLLELLSPAAK